MQNTGKAPDKPHHPGSENLKPPWRKGDPSPNPAGRPPGSGLTDRLRRLVEELEFTGSDGKKATAGEMMMIAGIRAAMGTAKQRPDFRFWKEIIERLDGKVPDRIAGHDGGPFSVTPEDEALIAQIQERFDHGGTHDGA